MQPLGNHIHPSGVEGSPGTPCRENGQGWDGAAPQRPRVLRGLPGTRSCSSARPRMGRFGANVCAGFAFAEFSRCSLTKVFSGACSVVPTRSPPVFPTERCVQLPFKVFFFNYYFC